MRLSACATALFLAVTMRAAEIVVPESLLVEGAPPVPAELAEAIGGYTKARSAEIVAWHPTRREMLIATRFGETRQLHRVAMPGGARTQLTFFDDDTDRGVSWQPHGGEAILFNKDRGGDENYQIYRLDPRRSAITLVTDGRSRNGAALWNRGGKRVVYTSNRRNGIDADLYLVDPAQPSTNRLLVQLEGAAWSPLSWSDDDSRILVQQQISAAESTLWIVDVAAGTKSPAFTNGVAASSRSYRSGAFAGKKVVTTSNAFSEFRELVSIDAVTGAVTRLTKHIPWDVIELALSPDAQTAAVVTNEAGAYTLHVIDLVTRRERKLPPIRGYVTNLRWRPDGKELGYCLDSAAAPTDVYSLDVTTKKLTRWTTSETGGVDTSTFAQPELVHWRSFDGRMISGFLYKPPARFAGKRPLLINIHGGPEDQFAPFYLGRWNYLLNELGVALLYPNIRGSAGFGKSFLALDDGLRREDALRDVGALLDWLPTRADLDAQRVMLTGISYGGYMTVSAAVAYGDRIRGAIDIVGPSSLVSFLEHTAEYRRDLRRVEYGDERDPAVRAFLERIAPLTNAHRITKPLLVVQGANDPAVPVAEAERIAAAVRSNGTPVWYILGRDEGHGFKKRRNGDYLFDVTILFLRQYLLN